MPSAIFIVLLSMLTIGLTYSFDARADLRPHDAPMEVENNCNKILTIGSTPIVPDQDRLMKAYEGQTIYFQKLPPPLQVLSAVYVNFDPNRLEIMRILINGKKETREVKGQKEPVEKMIFEPLKENELIHFVGDLLPFFMQNYPDLPEHLFNLATHDPSAFYEVIHPLFHRLVDGKSTQDDWDLINSVQQAQIPKVRN